MNNLIYLAIWGFGISSAISLSGKIENPLENPDFVYSEQIVQNYIEKAAQSKSKRIKQAFGNAKGEGLREGLVPFFADLWMGRNLDRVNKTFFEIFRSTNPEIRQKYRISDHWDLAINQQLYHMYYAFGSKGWLAAGRLNPKTEKALLELLWNRMAFKDDIHLARKSTWWMIGSENHDLVAKVSSLITAQIFMNEPAFRDRIYPDLGTGGGNKYWFHSMYANARLDGPQGRAIDKDGLKYTAADHYKAWVSYFDAYFTERAKKGFFLEVSSPGYMAVTVSHLMDIFDLCDNQRLKNKAEKFLDVVWADWAQDQLNGVRGGAKTRAKAGNRWADAMFQFARFYFGGAGNAGTHYFTQLLSSYELKPIIWRIALDRQGLGEFAYLSRKPGEEENIWPRPLGTERTMLCDTESRFVRYSWVTPDYILGCQMDHPAAVHSHLSNQARWLGITFKGKNGPRVYPTDAVKTPKGTFRSEGAYSRSIQHESVMLVQQSRRWFQVNPDWFPAKSIADKDYGVYFGTNHDSLIEKGGWIFVENEDAFLAVRVVEGEYARGWTLGQSDASPALTSELAENSYSWNRDHSMIYLKDKYAGIIFEASRRFHHKTLADFMDDILDNYLVLEKTVVPGFHILRYKGCGTNAKELYFNLANNEISMIDGERIDYAPDKVFDSPYLTSQYNSGVVKISKGGEHLVLDFNIR